MVKMILSYRFNPGKDKEPPKKEIKQYDKNLLKAFEKLSGGEKPIFKNQESWLEHNESVEKALSKETFFLNLMSFTCHIEYHR